MIYNFGDFKQGHVISKRIKTSFNGKYTDSKYFIYIDVFAEEKEFSSHIYSELNEKTHF